MNFQFLIISCVISLPFYCGVKTEIAGVEDHSENPTSTKAAANSTPQPDGKVDDKASGSVKRDLSRKKEVKVDDTPRGDFDLELSTIEGDCNDYPDSQRHFKEKQAIGREYIGYIGVEDSQIHKISCYYADFFFDTEGNGHVFSHYTEELSNKSKVERSLVGKLTLNKDKEGIWDLDYGQGSSIQVTVQFLRVDEKAKVIWKQTCDQGTRKGLLLVAFHKSSSLKKTNPWLLRLEQRISKELHGDKLPEKQLILHKIPHEKCVYQPEMEDPYY